VVDNDGLHGMTEVEGVFALEKGYHSVWVAFFEKTGGDDLVVRMKGPKIPKTIVPDSLLFHNDMR